MDSEAAQKSLTEPATSGGNTLVDAVADWLMEQALGTTSVEDLLNQCSLRLNAAGIPVWRANISFQILHPLYSAMSLTWYRETGSGMGATLNTAAAMDAYTLSDRGTWLSFRNKQRLKIVSQGDGNLRNQYGVILVSPRRHPHVKFRLGQRFIDWLLSPAGKAAIAAHKINGQQLFFPNR